MGTMLSLLTFLHPYKQNVLKFLKFNTVTLERVCEI